MIPAPCSCSDFIVQIFRQAVWGPQVTRAGLFSGRLKRPDWISALAERGAMAARSLEDLDWLSQPRAGLRFIEKDQGQVGAHPLWPTEEEGKVHDHEERGLGEARSEGAA